MKGLLFYIHIAHLVQNTGRQPGRPGSPPARFPHYAWYAGNGEAYQESVTISLKNNQFLLFI